MLQAVGKREGEIEKNDVSTGETREALPKIQTILLPKNRMKRLRMRRGGARRSTEGISSRQQWNGGGGLPSFSVFLLGGTGRIRWGRAEEEMNIVVHALLDRRLQQITMETMNKMAELLGIGKKRRTAAHQRRRIIDQ